MLQLNRPGFTFHRPRGFLLCPRCGINWERPIGSACHRCGAVSGSYEALAEGTYQIEQRRQRLLRGKR